jgi:hypothetical protein
VRRTRRVGAADAGVPFADTAIAPAAPAAVTAAALRKVRLVVNAPDMDLLSSVHETIPHTHALRKSRHSRPR